MDLELSDEQRWLAESVGRLLAKPSGDDKWTELIEFGVLAIASNVEGVGAIELALVGRALGERLTSVPFIDSAAARYASRSLASSEAPVFADLHAGEGVASLCLLEPGGSWELERLATTVSYRDDGGAVIDGQKAAVDHPAAADALLVLYGDGGERRLALISADSAGVKITPTTAIDPSLPVASVAFSDVEVRGEAAVAAELSEAVLARLLAVGGVLAASEAVGAAGQLVELARDYAAERRQFGHPIGSFQAVRHLLAEMHVRQTSAWSTVLFAAAALDDGLEDAQRTASIAKAYASRATLEVAQGALQVFGGIAFTEEHPAHRFLRRILVRGAQFGDARHHERAIGRELATSARREQVVV